MFISLNILIYFIIEMSDLISFSSVSPHITPIAISFIVWQNLVYILKRNNLSHLWFCLSHHVVLTCLSIYYMVNCRDVLSISYMIPFLEKSPVYTAPIGHIFTGYILADVLNRKLLKSPFTILDWIHHTISIVYTITCITLNPYNIDTPFLGLQELSSILLNIMYLGVKKPWVRIMFIISFLTIRIVLGGYGAIMRTISYTDNKIFINLIISVFWWLQFCINSGFTYIILKKAFRLKKN